jgi:uncharacterized lipoprotein YmbA
MNRHVARRIVRAVAAGFAVAALGACGTSPATRLYTLAPVAESRGNPASRSDAIVIGVRSVTLPEELDRPEIVTRTGPNTVQLAEFDQWSAPLRDSVMRVIGQDLTVLLSGDRVAVYPWPPGTSVDRELVVQVIRFDGQLGGRCVLHAQWQMLTRRGARSVISGRSTLNDACGPDYAAFAATQSRLLATLSAEIASAIHDARADVTAPRVETNSVPEDRPRVGE